MSPTRGRHIKRIFASGSREGGLLRSLRASTRHCSAAGNGAHFSGLVEKQAAPEAPLAES